MNKIFFLVFLIPLLIISCSNENKVELTGSIKGISQRNLYLYSNNEIVDSIPIGKDGNFNTKLDVPEGFYLLAFDKNRMPIYLKPGMKLSLSIDINDLPDGIKYSGAGSEENNFLVKQYAFNKEIDGRFGFSTFSMLTEKRFLDVLDSVFKVKNDYIENNYKGDNKYFKRYLTKSLDIQKDYYLYYYETAKKYYSKDTTFKVSENYPDIFKNFDFNDEELISNRTYIELISNYFTQKVDKNSPTVFLDIVNQVNDGIQNPNVKEQIVYNIVKDNLLNSKDVDKLYGNVKEFIISKDKKEKLEKIYNKIKIIEPGNQCHDFEFIDLNGKKYTRESFKGKVIFFDFWAVWCRPCLHEIPYLEELKKRFDCGNIVFVSVDVADPIDTWKQFVEKKGLTDLQLYAESWDLPFFKIFMINWIPRFIIIGKDGEIIDYNSIRPSDPQIGEKLNKILYGNNIKDWQ